MVKALPKALPGQILAGKCEMTQVSLGMESKAPRFQGTAGMTLRSKQNEVKDAPSRIVNHCQPI